MRKGNRNKISVGLCLCAAALTMGCSEGTDFGRLAGGDSGIGFEVSLAGEGEGVATRSTLGTKSFEGGASEGKTFRLRTGVTENRENPFASIAKSRATEITKDNLSAFGVYAYAYDSSKSWDDIYTTSSSYSLYISDDMVTQSGGTWGFTPARYWPSAYSLTFFAYAPTALDESGSGSTDGSFAVSLDGSDKLPQISYTVPSGYANQKDLVVATAKDQTESASSVPLKFEHILTAVQVKCGTFSEGTISNITLSGIKGKGTYDMATGSWSLDDTTTTYEVEPEVAFTAKDSASLLTEGYTLMLLPQKLGEEATITLTYTPTDGDPMTLTAGLRQEDLGDDKQEWNSGEKVTYVISYGNIDFNGHEGVDLGLSVIWATCNVGAESPADYGTYFQWGMITPPTDNDYSSNNPGLYGQSGMTESKIKGNPEYDAAAYYWGGGWRMPTKDEWSALSAFASGIYSSDIRVNSEGKEVTGFVIESSEGELFFPCGGYMQGTSLTGTNNCYLWSCTYYNRNNTSQAYALTIMTSIIGTSNILRYYGMPVRPVIDK